MQRMLSWGFGGPDLSQSFRYAYLFGQRLLEAAGTLLAEHRWHFSPTDRRWLSSTTTSLLRSDHRHSYIPGE